MLDLEKLREAALTLTQTTVLLPQEPHAVPPDAAKPVSLSPKKTKRFHFELPGSYDFMSPQEYLVEGLLPASGLGAVYGPPGVGKSFVVLDVCCHIASGAAFFGRPVMQKSVIYIAAEAGAGMHKRLAAWQTTHPGYNPSIAIISDAPDLSNTKNGEAGDLRQLIDDIEVQRPSLTEPLGLVVIDTLARVMPNADENSSSGMGAIISNTAALSRALGNVLVLLVHHAGKNSAQGMRGHSSLHGACDVEWLVSDDGDERCVELKKLKDGEDRLTWTFNLETVVLGQDTNRQLPVTSCAVVPLLPPCNVRSEEERVSGNDALILALIEAMVAEQDTNSNDSVRVLRKSLRGKSFEVIGNPDNPKAQSAIFNRCIRSLISKQEIHADDDAVWLNKTLL